MINFFTNKIFSENGFQYNEKFWGNFENGFGYKEKYGVYWEKIEGEEKN